MKVATVSDLHCKKPSRGAFEPLFAAMRAAADVLVLCGDLTDYGLPEEARVLVKELSAAKVSALTAPGFVLLKLAVTGFGVRLPPRSP